MIVKNAQYSAHVQNYQNSQNSEELSELSEVLGTEESRPAPLPLPHFWEF